MSEPSPDNVHEIRQARIREAEQNAAGQPLPNVLRAPKPIAIDEDALDAVVYDWLRETTEDDDYQPEMDSFWQLWAMQRKTLEVLRNRNTELIAACERLKTANASVDRWRRLAFTTILVPLSLLAGLGGGLWFYLSK